MAYRSGYATVLASWTVAAEWNDGTWNDDTVVLLDPSGGASGTGVKSQVHHADTPLHLAFSCYLFDDAGRFLVTTRATGKPSFGGVVTNSFCGHPRPGEPLPDAVRRRGVAEVGVQVSDVRLVLPEFRYQARSSSGMLENELCPVYTARALSPAVSLDPSEVEAAEWVDWAEFGRAVRSGERVVSEWATVQVGQLLELGAGPSAWPTADDSRLPPAARL